MTAKVKIQIWEDIPIASSGSILLTSLNKMTEENMKNVDSFFITSLGSGTLTFMPVLDGVETHVGYELTNDSGWLDFTGANDLKLSETSTTNPINVRVTAYRGQ